MGEGHFVPEGRKFKDLPGPTSGIVPNPEAIYCILMIRAMYHNASASVRVGTAFSDPF